MIPKAVIVAKNLEIGAAFVRVGKDDGNHNVGGFPEGGIHYYMNRNDRAGVCRSYTQTMQAEAAPIGKNHIAADFHP